MTETLTESFCERCGTRYTFETARPRVRLKGVRMLSRGLKNFVLSDDTSIDEAMAAARSEADREATAHQLDAFHKTFNFCMSCRQYTCPNCWNEPEARCLSCAPLALAETAADIHDLGGFREAILRAEPSDGNGLPIDAPQHWPALAETGLKAEAANAAIDRLQVEGQPLETQPVLQPLAEAPAESGWAIAAGVGPLVPDVVEPPAVTADEPLPAPEDAADKAAAQTLGLLQRFRPGQSLDAELDAFERERTDVAERTPEPVEAATEPIEAPRAPVEPAPEPVEAATEPIEAKVEPIEAVAEAEPPLAPEPEAAAATVALTPTPPLAAPEAAPPAPGAGADVVEQPTWRITAPDATPPPPPPSIERDGPVPLEAFATPTEQPDSGPQWPARTEWRPSSTPTAGLPFLGRPATPQGGIEALWAASNQQLVTAQPATGRAANGIQPCISCGLSLSATARFCRRCGTLQEP